MIGDWVLTLDSTHKEKVFAQVDAIEEGQHSILVTRECSNWFVDIDWIEPISLTSEILEKNGFIKKDDRLTDVYHLLVPTGFERSSFTIQVSLEPICGVSTLVKCWGWLPPYNGGLNDIHLCSANYAHQLQHALRLCGIEKEIIL